MKIALFYKENKIDKSFINALENKIINVGFNNNNTDLGSLTGVNGGAVYLGSSVGRIDFENCYFGLNKAQDGGAVYSKNTMFLIDNTFEENEAVNGGALYLNNGASIENSVFTSNIGVYGAAIYNSGNLTISTAGNGQEYTNESSSFDGNEGYDLIFVNEADNVYSKGGAIYLKGRENNSDIQIEIDNVSFKDNSANCGGAIYADNKTKLTVKET